MSKNLNEEEISLVMASQIPQKYESKYLLVVVDRDITGEVYPFASLRVAQKAFFEISHTFGYKPEEINGSDEYDVSIWKYEEDRYEKLQVSI